jgi:type VI secretion system protein ImpF
MMDSRDTYYMPCLFWRLKTDSFSARVSGRGRTATGVSSSVGSYRKAVVEDIMSLLNCRVFAELPNLNNYPEVVNSVVNYGVGSSIGLTVSMINVDSIISRLRNAIIRFEPRIVASTLKVGVTNIDKPDSVRKLSIEISGQLIVPGYLDEIRLQTEIEVDTGYCKLGGGL